MKPSPDDVNLLNGHEYFFTSDEYLLPTLEDDPLLRECVTFFPATRIHVMWLLEVQLDDWSDDEEEDAAKTDPVRRIKTLEQKLALAKQSLDEYRAFVAKKLDLGNSLDAPLQAEPSQTTAPDRDDDTHYFKSYAENGMTKKVGLREFLIPLL
ncbi:hypothetical protein C0989_011848 [Termitomyces sp. Mn162]|nr:hypothetical protein C0989_011848 [Termitomyces sp. Mn162]